MFPEKGLTANGLDTVDVNPEKGASVR